MKKPTDETGPGSAGLPGAVHETEIGDRTPSEAVIDACAAVLDSGPAALTPLYRTIDPEALDALCTDDENGAGVTVQFDYEGLLVTVAVPDRVSVVEP